MNSPPPTTREILLASLRERRFAAGLVCPRCGSRSAHRWGSFRGRQRYRCRGCLRTFSDLTGTPLAYSKRLSRWTTYIQCMREATSVREAALRTGIHPSTAWRWRHRLLAALRASDDSLLSGFIEVSELIMPEARKGCRALGRPPRTHTMAWCPWYVPRVFVALACDRRQVAEAVIVPDRPPTAHQLSALLPKLGADPLLLAPLGRAGAYRRWAAGLRTQGLEVRCLAAPSERRPGERSLHHRGTVTRFRWAWREWMVRFRGVSTCYLLNYLAWFRFTAVFGPVGDEMDWMAPCIPGPAGSFRKPTLPAN